MILTILDRFIFMFVRRLWLGHTIEGFRAGIRCYVDRQSSVSKYNRLYGKCLVVGSTIGVFTYATHARICNARIGKFCSIGIGTIVGGLGRHPVDWASTHPIFYSTLRQCGQTFAIRDSYDEVEAVEIGHDVWIGANVTILDGVHIGNGAIVAAGAVVTKDVPNYALAGGVPARVIRQRFSADVCESLNELCWWDWPESVLRANAHLFRGELDQNKVESLRKLASDVLQG